MNASLPSSYDILRRAETEARFDEWEGNILDAAHRREVATCCLLEMGVTSEWIDKQWGAVVADLDSELLEKQGNGEIEI